MALMYHISVSVQALTPKRNQNPLPALISKLGWNALDMGKRHTPTIKLTGKSLHYMSNKFLHCQSVLVKMIE